MDGPAQRGGVARRVVVAGGGLAGVTAALACADAGAEVHLFESRRALGGAAGSLTRAGMEIDAGQHVFLRCCAAYRALLRRLDVEHLTELQARMDIAVLHPDGRRGRLTRNGLPAPLHLAGALVRYPFLSSRERFMTAPAALGLRRLDPDDPALDEVSFGSWLVAHAQSTNAVAALWDLIATPTLNLHASEAGLAGAARVFKTGLLEHPAAADIGIAAVPLARLHDEPAADALACAGVRVHKGVAVKSVLHAAGEVRGVSTRRGELLADAVIVAVPHDRVPALVPASALADPSVFERLGGSAIVSAHLVYDRSVFPGGFAAALDSPVQWIFDRTDAAGVSRGQYLTVTLSDADHLLQEPVDAVRRLLEPALATLLPAAQAAQVERFFVTRVPAATFRQGVGSARLRPGAVTRMPGLFLAGAYTATGWPATMEGAVRSGLTAAAAATGRCFTNATGAGALATGKDPGGSSA